MGNRCLGDWHTMLQLLKHLEVGHVHPHLVLKLGVGLQLRLGNKSIGLVG